MLENIKVYVLIQNSQYNNSLFYISLWKIVI